MHRLTRFRLALVLALVASLAVTSSVAVAQEPESGSPLPSASPSAALAPEQPEGAWEVTHYDAWGEGLVEPRDGSELTVSLLTRGRLEGRTGCGDYHGGYSLEDERIGLGIVSKGFGECATKKNEEAVAFSVALEAVETWQATASGLEFLDDVGSVRVVLERPAFTDVTGTWIAERYTRANGQPMTPLEDVPIILDLHSDGRVTGSSGCRFLEGEYTREGTRILIGPIEPLGPACTGDARKQERRLFKLFAEIAQWTRDDEGLIFDDAFGQTMLILREQVEPDVDLDASPEPIDTETPAEPEA